MINWTVISVKEITKIILKLILSVIIVYSLTKIYNNCDIKNFSSQSIDISKYNIAQHVKLEIPRFEKQGEKKDNIEYAKIPIKSELSVFDIDIEEQIEEEKEEIIFENENIIGENQIIENVATISSYSFEYKNVKIKNQTSFEITDDILSGELNINMNNILIFHTHTCESYTTTEKNYYESTGNFRTTDLNYTVAKVGDELEKNLLDYGYKVIHDKTYHDYPSYSGSYGRSLETIKNTLKQNNNYDIVIDLHRDAVGSNSGYCPSILIEEESVAQLMFVIGTDGGGLEHPNWRENLKFAIAVQQKAEELYPNLFKPIILRNSRYNQHLSKAACIIEVGATGNTLEQTTASMKYLAQILNELR